MKIKIMYTGILKSGKRTTGTVELRSHRKVSKTYLELGKKLRSRYKKEDLPMTDFKFKRL